MRRKRYLSPFVSGQGFDRYWSRRYVFGMKKEIYVIAHNIRSVHNVGSFFRTCDAVGVSKIYLTGFTPAPVDRFGRDRNDVHKTALGAEKTVSWEQVEDIKKVVDQLKKEGVVVVGLEQDSLAVDYRSFNVDSSVALIVGNEPDGIPKEVREMCDALVEIPMRGKKESLNVSVALGIALYEFLK
jgi:23S rRNA (guanosine2251-2'-O)-methyltransferase